MSSQIIVFFFIAAFSVSCFNKKPSGIVSEDHHHVSVDVVIRKIFPGAVQFNNYTDSLFFFLYAVHNIPENRILLGQSIYVDDELNTKDPFADHQVKWPFNLGGWPVCPLRHHRI